MSEMSLDLDFDPTTITPKATFGLLPKGVYDVSIQDVVHRAKKDDETSTMFAVTLVVEDGPLAGRKLWDNITHRNRNPEAVRIGQEKLTTLMHAAGCPGARSAAALIGRSVRARVGIDGEYNRVMGYVMTGDASAAPSSSSRTVEQAKKPPSFMVQK